MDEEKYQEYLDFAKEIADYAGKTMKKYFGQMDKSEYKGDKTIVTIADKEINSYLIEKVKEKYPTHSVDGEEEQYGLSKYVWVCDPIDGTAMFARGIPVATFSLALVIDGIPTVGVICDPFTDSTYTAIKGQGAYKNNKRISVNDYEIDDMRSLAHIEWWPRCKYNVTPVLNELGKRVYFVSLGSVVRASTCVATGDCTFAICPLEGHKNCDIAAAKVIVEEAGGIVTNLFGEEQRCDRNINGVVISNKIVHKEVVDVIKKYL